jgi:hypothetical protein
MRVVFIAAAAAAVLCIAARPAQAQAIPDLNVDPVCHGIAQQAANPSEKGGPDLAFSQCVQSEQAMRQKLVGKWVEWRATPILSAVSKWQKPPGCSIRASSDRASSRSSSA